MFFFIKKIKVCLDEDQEHSRIKQNKDLNNQSDAFKAHKSRIIDSTYWTYLIIFV